MPRRDAAAPSIARSLAAALAARGVRRMFGIPGGGSSLEVIDAAADAGIGFVLTRSETAAAMMASVTGELTGIPGVALGTKGPGVANAANGLAYALLDRAPLLYLADGFSPAQHYMTHQVFEQAALVRPIVKAAEVVTRDSPQNVFEDLLDTASAWPRGPVYAEITSSEVRQPLAGPARMRADTSPAAWNVAEARALLAAARRPVIVAGLQAVQPDAHAALVRLADALNCPVFPTYKAKGVLADADPRVIGLYVGGAGEAEAVAAGDLIVLVGADPVEFALQPWRYDLPVLEIARHPFGHHYVRPAAGLYGEPAAAVDALLGGGALRRPDWTPDQMEAARAQILGRLAIRSGGPLTPQHVIDIAARVAGTGARISVDAGAHMLPVMAFWQAARPLDVLISNGLATMGFALPAAIAAALETPARHTLAFTGDGGLMMCAGELATAAQQRCRLAVVVLNDAALSMIGVKQRRSGFRAQGVEFSPTDFSAVARGFGLPAWRAHTPGEFEHALAAALAHPGPTLVDAVVDPSGYHDQVKALRG